MIDKMIEDFKTEQESIRNLLEEKKKMLEELEKATSSTTRDISFLQGRLSEITAISEYVENSKRALEVSEDADNSTGRDPS